MAPFWRQAVSLLGVSMALLMTRSHPSAAASTTLTILHTNDIHGHLTAWRGWEGELAGKTIGGLDRLAAAIKQVRAAVSPENLLLLDAGDTLGDTLIAEAAKGQAILTVMNALGYDAMTIGNHEPDFTADVLREHIRSAVFPILAANILNREDGSLFTMPYLIRTVAGVKVGILGLAYPNTPLTTAQKNITGLEFRDVVSTVREYLPRLQREGAQLLLVLSHYGLSAEKHLAEVVPEIDIIIGGHSHNRMTDALQVGKTLIMQAGAHGSDLGRLDLSLAAGRVVAHHHTLITLDHAALPADPDTARLIDGILTPHRTRLEERIGKAATIIARAQTLAGQTARKRDEESPADTLFADILRESTHSDVALLPGVGYGVAIQPGPITAADLRNLIPHSSKVVTLTLTGAEIRTILEQSVENVLTDDPQQKVGGIIQVSGLRFRYDPHAPSFHRVLAVSISGAPLAPDRRYRVATNSLLSEGGHRYQTFREGRDRQEHAPQYEIVKAWIARQSAVSPPPEDRIVKSSAQKESESVQQR